MFNMVSDGALMSATDCPPFGFHVHDSTSLYCGTAYRRLRLLWSGLTGMNYIPCSQLLKHEYSYGLSLYHIIAVDKLYSTSLLQCEQWNNLHDKLVVALEVNSMNWKHKQQMRSIICRDKCGSQNEGWYLTIGLLLLCCNQKWWKTN
jgi:hypothetical protein